MTFRLRKSASAAASRPSAAQYSVIVLAERGRGRADFARRAGEARHHMVHRHAAHLGIGQFGHDLARLHMRVGDELVDVVDRRGGDLGLLEHGEILGKRARLDEFGDRPLRLVDVLHAVGVGAKARVVDHVGAADRAVEPLRHALDRGRDGDEAAVLGLIHVARRGVVGAAADARLDLAGELIERGLGPEDREDRIEQRQVDHLTRAAALLDLAQRDQHGARAVEARDHVGERERRQHRRAVGEAVLRRESRHALHQAAEARLVAIGPVLPPARRRAR